MASARPLPSETPVDECGHDEVQHFSNSSNCSRKGTLEISSHDSLSTSGSQGEIPGYTSTASWRASGNGNSDGAFHDNRHHVRRPSSTFVDIPLRPSLQEQGGSQAIDSTSFQSSPSPDERPYEAPSDAHQKRWDLFRRNLRNVCNMRENVLESRISARYQRECLEKGREYMAAKGAELMMNLNVLFAQTQRDDVSLVLNLFEQFQRARDTYQAMEHDYEEFEIDYVAGEYQLEKTEKKLQYFSEEFWGSEPIHHKPPDPNIGLNSMASAVRYQPNIALHDPLTFAYLSSTKDAELLRDHLADVRIEEVLLLEEKATRKRHGLALDEESQSFLEHFDEYEHQVQNQLSILKGVARNKKVECLAQGLLDWEDTLSLYSDSSSQDIAGLPTVPLLLLWDQERPLFFECSLRPGQTMGQGLNKSFLLTSSALQSQQSLDTTARINKWLLHKLCASTLDIHLLRDMPELESLHISEKSFRDLVLDWWNKDGAAINPVIRPHSDGDSIDLELYHLMGTDYRHSGLATYSKSDEDFSAVLYASDSLQLLVPPSNDLLDLLQAPSDVGRVSIGPRSFPSESRKTKRLTKSLDGDDLDLRGDDFDTFTV